MTSFTALAMFILEMLNLRQIAAISGNPKALSGKIFDVCFTVVSFICDVVLMMLRYHHVDARLANSRWMRVVQEQGQLMLLSDLLGKRLKSP
jgi:hypothetical protein